jgi:uncharacterized protein
VSFFFDTSALAKLYHREIGTAAVRKTFEEQHSVYVCRVGSVEMQSALSLKIRTNAISRADAELVQLKFRAHIRDQQIRVIAMKAAHYDLDETLLETYGYIHALRTLDSIQLAVAVDLVRSGIVNTFVTSDKVLIRIASIENLTVWDPASESSGDLLM